MLERVEKSLAAIKTKLLNDETVRKLIYNDSNNALALAAPSVANTEPYITLFPIYEFENKQEYEQNGIINIVMTEVLPDDEIVTISGTIQINVAFNIDKWQLVENKIRPLQLANQIIKLVDKQKFNISNSIEFDSMQQLILSKQLVGYALLFHFVDGSGKINNF